MVGTTSVAPGAPARVRSPDVTFEALLLDADSPAVALESEAGLRQRIEALRRAGVAVALISTADAVDVERILTAWWDRGIGPGLVGVVATPRRDGLLGGPGSRLTLLPVAGDPAGLVDLLDDQLQRRRQRRVPAVDHDPAWTVVVDEQSSLPPEVQASLLTVANGRVGIRGDREEDTPPRFGEVTAVGVYDGRAGPGLLPGPRWTGLAPDRSGGRERRVLDLRTGVLWRETEGRSAPRRTVRFVSLARPHAAAWRAEGSASALQAGPALLPPPAEVAFEQGSAGRAAWARTRACGRGAIVAAALEHQHRSGPRRMVERLVACVGDPDRTPATAEVLGRLDELRHAGFDRLLAEHRAAWAARWRDAEVTIDGDPEAQLAARFALFHLMGSVPTTGQAAVGARGLSGPAYAGHVFWDTDVYMLPPLVAVCPPAARAILEYRIRRLDAARRAASGRRLRGARFPWESAGDGTDATPRLARLPDGGIAAIRTGEHEEHITADVAWAAWQYHQWTGDTEFLAGRGRDLITDAARYWADRVRPDRHGAGHLYGVIGPDEYHEPVDDNAFTNVMARWNLRLAARLVSADGIGGTVEQAERWRAVAESLVDGYDPATGRYRQFTGYDRLEPLLVRDVATPPVAADVVLGRKRLAGSQIIKQPDVLLLHHMVPDETEPGSLVPNLDFYGPRTAHGSSLSPAIEAALLARAGRPDDALDAFRMAARLDLDDLTGTTSAGLHLATMGGLWQALAQGFVGLRPLDGVLRVDPHLPGQWRSLGLRLRFRGARLGIVAGPETVAVSTDRPVSVQVAQLAAVTVAPPGMEFRRRGGRWREGVQR